MATIIISYFRTESLLPVIDKRQYNNENGSGTFYYCKLHPDIENINLESIEHHCKYKDPELHKSEILKTRFN